MTVQALAGYYQQKRWSQGDKAQLHYEGTYQISLETDVTLST